MLAAPLFPFVASLVFGEFMFLLWLLAFRISFMTACGVGFLAGMLMFWVLQP